MAHIADSSEIQLGAAISSLRTNRFADDLAVWIQSCLSHDCVTILAYFQDRLPSALMVQSAHPWVHANMEKTYLTGAYLLDPFHDLHINMAPPGAYRLSDISPDQFRRHRYFLEYYCNTTMIDEIGFVAYPSNGVSLHVCVGRDDQSKQRFSSRDVAVAKRIAPVATALIERHWQNLTPEGEYTEGDVIRGLIRAAYDNLGISLSPRQAEVAMLVLKGHSSASIGMRLGVSYQTVKVFRRQLYQKCAISSQAELFTLLLPLLGARQNLERRDGAGTAAEGAGR